MKLNPDKEVVEAIRKRLVIIHEAYGQPYCPCVPQDQWNKDTVCMCKAAREDQECHCGLYV